MAARPGGLPVRVVAAGALSHQASLLLALSLLDLPHLAHLHLSGLTLSAGALLGLASSADGFLVVTPGLFLGWIHSLSSSLSPPAGYVSPYAWCPR